MSRSMAWMSVGLAGVALTSGCVERLIYELGVCGDGRFAAGDVCFSADGRVAHYTTPGLTPVSIRGADFTGDGKPDVLVMGLDAAGAVAGRTLLGIGDGTLGTAVDAGLFGCSAHPVPGIVDGDSPVDLLVDECSDSVSLFVGTSSGSFAGPQSVFVGARTRSSGLVDLDRDGTTDVMVLGTAPDETAVLTISFPNDSGNLVTVPVSNIGEPPFDPMGFGVADVGTADARIVLIDPAVVGGLAIMEDPLTDGSVARLPVDFTPRGAAVADLDEDGEDELLVAALEAGALITLEIDAPGTAPNEVGRTDADVDPLARQIADVDGDGHIDMIVSEAGSTDLGVWRGRGDGRFEAPVYVDIGLVAEQFFLSDLDGDGAPDLVAANFVDGDIVVLLADP